MQEGMAGTEERVAVGEAQHFAEFADKNGMHVGVENHLHEHGSLTGELPTARQGLAEPPVPTRDVLNHANFGLLPRNERRAGSFGVAFAVNVAVALLLLFFTIDQVHEANVRRQETLVYVAPPPKPYVPPVPKVQMPPIPQLPHEEPKIIPPVAKPVIEPPKVELPKEAAKAPALPAPAPKPVVTPPRPALAFQQQQAPASQAPKLAATQSAGFGAPIGVQANPNANRPAQLAAVGGFGAAANSNQGAPRQSVVAATGFGTGAPAGSSNGSAHGVAAQTGFGAGAQPAGIPGGRGTVASTGFGNSPAQGGSPNGHGTVASTGFGQTAPAAAATQARVQQPATTPIVILSKPLPQYTSEAREEHIQGDVTLEVRFSADGQVEVERVVSGLGHGLDEQAKLAAARIRFKPATRDGKPVDQVSVIHVAFQLA